MQLLKVSQEQNIKETLRNELPYRMIPRGPILESSEHKQPKLYLVD